MYKVPVPYSASTEVLLSRYLYHLLFTLHLCSIHFNIFTWKTNIPRANTALGRAMSSTYAGCLEVVNLCYPDSMIGALLGASFQFTVDNMDRSLVH